MKIQNNRDSASREITNFDWQLGRYKPSSPSTKKLHATGCGTRPKKFHEKKLTVVVGAEHQNINAVSVMNDFYLTAKSF